MMIILPACNMLLEESPAAQTREMNLTDLWQSTEQEISEMI